MKINLTQEQYRDLVKVFFLGQWLMKSHSLAEDGEMDDLEQYLYSFADSFACKDWIVKDKDHQRFYPTRDMEEELDAYIDEYDEYTFWEELTQRLAKRDFNLKTGAQKRTAMDAFEIVNEIDKIAGKYEEEFKIDGLERLNLS